MQGLEGSIKSLTRAISVADGNIQNSITGNDLCGRSGQPTPPNVFGYRQTRERSEHSSEMIFRGQRHASQPRHINWLGQIRVDGFYSFVPLMHVFSFSHH